MCMDIAKDDDDDDDDDDDEEEEEKEKEKEEEQKEDEDNVTDVRLCGDQGIDRVADISEDWTNTDWESDGN